MQPRGGEPAYAVRVGEVRRSAAVPIGQAGRRSAARVATASRRPPSTPSTMDGPERRPVALPQLDRRWPSPPRRTTMSSCRRPPTLVEALTASGGRVAVELDELGQRWLLLHTPEALSPKATFIVDGEGHFRRCAFPERAGGFAPAGHPGWSALSMARVEFSAPDDPTRPGFEAFVQQVWQRRHGPRPATGESGQSFRSRSAGRHVSTRRVQARPQHTGRGFGPGYAAMSCGHKPAGCRG